MTREERLRSEDMGKYFRVAADNRDLNYDKFFVQGKVETQAEESYTSHNTVRLDVDGVVSFLLSGKAVKTVFNILCSYFSKMLNKKLKSGLRSTFCTTRIEKTVTKS